ncbi:arylesterase [Croceicoccus naphthovorans]|uniref:Uncharacterized protein n=1 Tax=Croceicoccus naphthovorans TaxID=1348774 RepID=A0A0G3XE89_9SPHN|nr:arylesterase [Croceicoccus naphthovorans]AKM09512.1 hypothetical protein AB433_05200 [Croceicoccus naphthovorans]MBB3989746.1 acyl-CoA thioesterase-1 [Croceicoccus naphthovorans]
MKKFVSGVVAALLLSACGQDSGSSQARTADPDRPVGQPTFVLAFGDSLFAGYNLPQSAAYPAQLEQALRQRGLNVRIQNAGVSGDTTSAGKQRMAFVLDSMTVQPDYALVEFGANDMLRGLSPDQARQNLDAILAEMDRRGIEVLLYEMKAAPNLGRDYATRFESIYPDLAEKYDATVVPFFIEPLIFDRSLVQRDQVHPTEDGVKAMVEETVDVVEDAID